MSLAAGGLAMRAAGAQPGGVDAWQEDGFAGVWSRENRRSPGGWPGLARLLAAHGRTGRHFPGTGGAKVTVSSMIG